MSTRQPHGELSATFVAITHLKLQKLLYFCYGCYLARTGEELFAEPLEAWPKGPVEPGQWRRVEALTRLRLGE